MMRIGEVADRAGVSARTLRYYEELGLLSPSSKTAGGARRYDDRDVERLLRIRELQELMGFNLDEIAVIVHAEHRLSDIRAEWLSSEETPEQRIALLAEATEINERLRSQVRAKLERLQDFEAGLLEKAKLYESRRAELLASGAAGQAPAAAGAPVGRRNG